MLPDDKQRWEAVLNRLEEGVATALRAMEDPLDAPAIELWSPPADLGPLPVELRERMERLIEAQKALLEMVAGRRDDVGKQIKALRRVPGVGEPERSLYLDISG